MTAFRISTLRQGDTPFDRDWQEIEQLPAVEWRGKAYQILHLWLEEVQPEPGSYRCVGPGGDFAEESWKGGQAA